MSGMMPWTRRSEDELISAYLDGQLGDAGRRAFEARIHHDAILRQKVAATRALMGAARRLPRVDAPRNFTRSVSRSMAAATAKPDAEQPSRIIWRVGSALAAAVFVITLGLEAIGGGQPATRSALRAAPSLAIRAPAATNSNADTSAGALPNAGGATAATMASESTPAPSFKVAPMAEATSVISAPTQTPYATPTAQLRVQPAAGAILTPTAKPPDIAPAPIDQPLHPLDVIAAFALGVAVIMGALGWVVKREV